MSFNQVLLVWVGVLSRFCYFTRFFCIFGAQNSIGRRDKLSSAASFWFCFGLRDIHWWFLLVVFSPGVAISYRNLRLSNSAGRPERQNIFYKRLASIAASRYTLKKNRMLHSDTRVRDLLSLFCRRLRWSYDNLSESKKSIEHTLLQKMVAVSQFPGKRWFCWGSAMARKHCEPNFETLCQ